MSSVVNVEDWDLEGIPRPFWPHVRTGLAEAVSSRVAVGVLSSLIAIKQVAGQLEDEAMGRQLADAAGAAMADFDGDWCGTGPHKPPIPKPHIWQILEVAAELAQFAQRLPEDSPLRADTQSAASELARGAFG